MCTFFFFCRGREFDDALHCGGVSGHYGIGSCVSECDQSDYGFSQTASTEIKCLELSFLLCSFKKNVVHTNLLD